MFRFDSYFYAQLSYFISIADLNSFFFENNDFFAVGRLLLYFPTALFYRVFGVNDFTSAVFILFSSLVNIVVVYFLGKKLVNHKVGLLAAFLISIYPLDVVHSTQYLPDGLLPLFLSLSALVFLYGEDENDTRKRATFYYLAGVFIGLAEYVRENAFVFTFVFLVYILFKRSFKIEYFLILVGGATIFILAGIFFLIGTGDFFFQINQVLKQFSSTRERLSGSTDRVIDWLGFTKTLLTDGIFRPFSLMIVVSTIFSLMYRRKDLAFVLIWFFTLLIYLEVFSQLHGLAKHARYLSIVTVPIVLMLSSFLVFLTNHFKIKIYFAVIFLILFAAISFFPSRIISSKMTSHGFFNTYRALAIDLEKVGNSEVFIQNLKHKGYIFNYTLGFDSLNYNSFKRDRVEGTESLLRGWDGKEAIKPGSYVVIDSNVLKKKVQPNWELVGKRFKASIYYIPHTTRN
jgi:4-amino-4-deoxy-L-arabinose transferase-like glycosyltransferase